jgi:peptidyl-tRNA hydrolase, PTH1 family
VDPTNQQPFRIIVGLGNPGRQYAGTRHNAGFMILDELAARAGAVFRHESKWDAEVASAGGALFCKPSSYMNLSGAPVRALVDFYKYHPADVLVILDDAALPLGKLRIRRSGSAGGHNGLQSVMNHLGTEQVARLRVGIGGAEGRDMADHVLSRFAADEEPVLKRVIERAADAVEFAQKSGIEAAMNQFNQPEEQP